MLQGAARCSRVQQGATGCSQVGPGCSRGCGWMSPNSGRAPRCSMGTAGRSKCAAGCSRVRPGCTGAAGCSRVQPGVAGAQPEAPQARSKAHLGAAGAQSAAPHGRSRGAAGAQPAQRVQQGALSEKPRRTSTGGAAWAHPGCSRGAAGATGASGSGVSTAAQVCANRQKTGPFPHQEKTLLSL